MARHPNGTGRMTVPYYEGYLATLYLGDARDTLAVLGKESVDLVVTDPPYGVAQRQGTRATPFDPIVGDASVAEATELLAACTPDLFRVLRRSRHAYTFGLPLVHEMFVSHAELIWDKGRLGSGDMSSPWAPAHETIHFQCRAADRANLANGKLAARLRHGSVLSVRRLSATQVGRHPTEKPVALMQQLVETSSHRDELVLDPFAGSGSTLVAALLSGRRAVGVEFVEKYAEIAAERLIMAERIVRDMGKV